MSRGLIVKDREAVIGFAHAHLGMGEHPPGSNNTVPGDWYGIDGPWCAMFQSWIFYSVLGFSPFPASTHKGFAACVAGAQWFRRQGKWASSSAHPKRGWLIFFTWPGDSIEHHIGLVLGASAPRDVDTIEGNTSDRVQLLHRRSSISGYGIIDYASTPTPLPQPPPFVPHFTRTLHPGMTLSSNEKILVRHFQALLKWSSVVHKQPLWNPGSIDGIFGRRTAVAFIYFKRACNDISSPDPFVPANSSLGPRGFGILTWWANQS